VVTLIRGGGSQVDLLCFDGYELANHIAQFPLPVITGIGHEKDTSVADLVAHTRLKTPTAAAEFLISQFAEAETIMTSMAERLSDIIEGIVDEQNLELVRVQNRVVPNILKTLNIQGIKLNELGFKARERSTRITSRLENVTSHYFNRVIVSVEKKIRRRIILMPQRCWYAKTYEITLPLRE
jgi:exodeoxyribonuclease VII large subunit